MRIFNVVCALIALIGAVTFLSGLALYAVLICGGSALGISISRVFHTVEG